MRRIGVGWLCVVAMLAVGAIASWNASAATFKACVKAKGGSFTASTCESESEVGKGEGKFELVSPAGDKYTSKSGTITFETSGLGTMICKKSVGAGEYTSETTGTDVMTLIGCSRAGTQCNSAGASPGTIETFVLATSLQENASGELENRFAGTGGSEGLSAEFECSGSKVRAKGSLGGIISGNVEKAEKTSTDTFSAGSEQNLQTQAGPSPFMQSDVTAKVIDKAADLIAALFDPLKKPKIKFSVFASALPGGKVNGKTCEFTVLNQICTITTSNRHALISITILDEKLDAKGVNNFGFGRTKCGITTTLAGTKVPGKSTCVAEITLTKLLAAEVGKVEGHYEVEAETDVLPPQLPDKNTEVVTLKA